MRNNETKKKKENVIREEFLVRIFAECKGPTVMKINVKSKLVRLIGCANSRWQKCTNYFHRSWREKT